jgi:hypothetical protein
MRCGVLLKFGGTAHDPKIKLRAEFTTTQLPKIPRKSLLLAPNNKSIATAGNINGGRRTS